ncbi:MAG: hypothetical protein LBP99_08110 [Azoarcus sp.]|jgi:hypothetical protein|nr:hypothetical protein [Azoarcus sp.]
MIQTPNGGGLPAYSLFLFIFRVFTLISGFSSSVANAIQTASTYSNLWRSDAPVRVAERGEGRDVFSPDSRSDGVSQESDNSRAEESSATDLRRVEELKSTDRAVRAHEAAHMAAGGSLVTSGASFSYETGPDGQRYAVAGEVGIDTSKGRTPEETLTRAQQIRAAALAPADPSGQDRAVAAAASQMATEARAEIARASMEKNSAGQPQENGANRSLPFGQAIERSLSPNGQKVNAYA